jgi:micrococcal nuclease
MTDNTHKYTYTAFVTKVYDGDTVTLDIDLGLNVLHTGEKCRLYRINTPEVRGEEKPQGIQSRDYLRGLILGKEVLIKTVKDRKGKYGRYLVEIWYKGKNVNDLLVSEGYAAYKEY